MSIYNLDKYKEFSQSILRRVPILKTAQLTAALVKMYDLSYKEAGDALCELQSAGLLLLSSDGYVMTKAAYIRLIDSRRIEDAHVYVNYRHHLPEMQHLVMKNEYYVNCIDCMWLVIDMLPLSVNFVICPEPWDIVFDVAGDTDNASMLYQITRIPVDKEDVRCELLKCVAKVSEYMREKIVRIAVMDNKEHNWMVPKIGFRYIVKLDESSDRHYVITEDRTGGSVWE